ncbi:hypothetical protein B0I37DRAFT_322087 [Chaetomium sp. MPI-CAGE-AT-0009]|nr:hypothetical protein B0I37DRAFT_322087 [Chaetomium sp. MPI-CAGE-AT-0009]
MAQGCGILGLPDTVLGRICSQFCPHCAGEDCLGGFALPDSFGGPEYFGTLAALTQVNLRIGRLAQAARLHVFCGHRDSLPLLARTLLDRPELGDNIRVVRLGHRDKDSDHGCVLRELGTPQAVDTLKNLAGLGEEANLDLLSIAGEQRLLAPFKQLPPTEDSFFCPPRLGDMVLDVPGDVPPIWAPADALVAMERMANARLNASILFKLAKKVRSVAILSEWPLAVFPELTPNPKTNGHGASQTNHPDFRLLPEVEILRLDSSNENPHRQTKKCLVDMSKIVGIISHLANARNLEIRGGEHSISGQKVTDICRPSLKNITSLNLTATSNAALNGILSCFTSGNLKHFRFTIPSGSDNHVRNGTNTVPTLSAFIALRRVIISADNIYYPSLFPRVFLRDGYTSSKHGCRRLIDFLPRSVESLEIVGIYAIHAEDVANIPIECHPNGKLPNLKNVILCGKAAEWPMLQSITQCNYPLPTDEGEDIFDDWSDVAEHAKVAGPNMNEQVQGCYAQAGVEYAFDMPEYFIDQYVGDWNKDPEDAMEL